MKYNKGFALIALLAIIAGVLVVGGGAYLWGKNRGEEKKGIENPIVNNQMTDDFISYVDSTYGFSLSYDKSKPFTGEKPFSIDASMVKSVYLCIKDGKNYLGDPIQLKGMGFSNISGCEYKQYGFNNQMPTVDMVANEAINHKLRPFGENPIIQDITLSRQPAKIVLSDSKNIEEPESASIFVKLPNPIVGDKGYSSYILIIYTTKPFVQDIVSSFKFIDTVGYKEFKNDELGFSFSYPSSLGVINFKENKGNGDDPNITFNAFNGESFIGGFFSLDSYSPKFYFSGMSRNYNGGDHGNIARVKDENCSASLSVINIPIEKENTGIQSSLKQTSSGDKYAFQIMTPDGGRDSYWGFEKGIVAYFTLKSGNRRFPCLGIASQGGISDEEFLKIMDTVKIY